MIVTRGLGRALILGAIVATGLGVNHLAEVVPEQVTQSRVQPSFAGGGTWSTGGTHKKILERAFVRFTGPIRGGGFTAEGQAGVSVSAEASGLKGGGYTGKAVAVAVMTAGARGKLEAQGFTPQADARTNLTVIAETLPGRGEVHQAKIDYLSIDELLTILGEMT